MTDWDARVRSWREDYIDALEGHGFRRVDDEHVEGTVDAAGAQHRVIIDVGGSAPFTAPRVEYAGDTAPRSWHIDPFNEMCLYTEDDKNDAPWLNASALIERIVEWFTEAAGGWPGDLPLIEANRYLPPDPRGKVIVHGDLTDLVGSYVRLRGGFGDIVEVDRVIGRPQASRNGRPSSVGSAAWVSDLGELSAPIRNWDELAEVLPDHDRVRVDISQGRVGVLLLRYTRAGRPSVLAVHATPTRTDIVLTSYQTSDTGTVRYRSGADLPVLADRSVCIVGAGAVGSFLADLLARDGVGAITVWDGEELLPGNYVRHMCLPIRGDRNKAAAVAAAIRRYAVSVAQPRNLSSVADAAAMIADHDLVIDATGDGAVTRMLTLAATEAGAHVLSVCVQNDGATVRVDVIPPLDDSEPLPETTLTAPTGTPHLEAGCGEPVSPTPPHAVVHAAAVAARHAVGLLTGRPITSNGAVITTPAA